MTHLGTTAFVPIIEGVNIKRDWSATLYCLNIFFLIFCVIKTLINKKLDFINIYIVIIMYFNQ
jgi:hypothetical protein